jgi:predicted membrane protein
MFDTLAIIALFITFIVVVINIQFFIKDYFAEKNESEKVNLPADEPTQKPTPKRGRPKKNWNVNKIN